MSSRSSPRDLATLHSGSRIFIDANIFIYHFTRSPLTAACTAFLQRVEIGDIEGVSSVITLAEVAHRLMILEAIQKHGLQPHEAVRKLKGNPALVQQLSHYKVASELIPSFNVFIEAVTVTHLRSAQELSGTNGLLTNDSLTAAGM
jgi:predicted nucleic acid-binding protein